MKRVEHDELSGVRGFNYQPSHGGHGVEIWGPGFDAAAVARDLARARELFPGMNTIRLWLSHDAYLRHGGACAARFEAALAAADGAGLRVIPVLFNNWHSIPDFGGVCPEMINYWFKAFGREGQAAGLKEGADLLGEAAGAARFFAPDRRGRFGGGEGFLDIV